MSCSPALCAHVCWTPPGAREWATVGGRGPVKYSHQQRRCPREGGQLPPSPPSSAPQPLAPCLLGWQTPRQNQNHPCDPLGAPAHSSTHSAWTRAPGDSSDSRQGRPQDSVSPAAGLPFVSLCLSFSAHEGRGLDLVLSEVLARPSPIGSLFRQRATDGGRWFPGCSWALGQGTPARLHRETDGSSPRRWVVQAGQTRLGRLAPGRTGPWSGRQRGAVCRTRLPGGPRPPSLRHAPEPLPWDTPSAAQGGAASPSDPTRPWNKGREAPAAPETVPQGSRPPTSQQPRSSPFTPRPQPSAAEPWLVSGRTWQVAEAQPGAWEGLTPWAQVPALLLPAASCPNV